jgi:predicted AlkP superfamily phosphohydrolase/phosphomutase
MKICVLGLQSATPEIIFGDERLVNLRRLMDLGAYGRLKSVVPPVSFPAWMCMTTSQDPGSLGLYGSLNRADYSYNKPRVTQSSATEAVAIWDHLAKEGKRSIVIGVPLNCPPRSINGISVGCFLTPDPNKDAFTYPGSIKAAIHDLVGDYPVDVATFRTTERESLRDEIFSMSRKQWQVVHWLLKEQHWDYFQYIDIGLDRVQLGFWNCFDSQHPQYEARSPYENVISDYYAWLDEQVGLLMESLPPDTVLLLASNCGTQRLDGEFAINQWLVEEGLLVLNGMAHKVSHIDESNVNWSKTRVWSEGGSFAQLFINVTDREPQGVVPMGEYDAFRDQLKAKLEGLADQYGRPYVLKVLRPEQIYRQVNGVAPDLLVEFADHWRSVSSLGHPTLQLPALNGQCNNAQEGAFILVAPNNPLAQEFEGAHLLDMTPTLLDLAGYEIPSSMQGRSLVANMEKRRPSGPDDEERLILERLAGLGYV